MTDEDPLTFFLTPAPLLDVSDDEDVAMIDFDADIEDSKNPPQTVRSISPSSLEGLNKLPSSRFSLPDHDADLSSVTDDYGDDDEDDDEEHIRFNPGPGGRSYLGLPFSLPDSATLKAKRAGWATHSTRSTDALLSPSSFHVPDVPQSPPAGGAMRHSTGNIRDPPIVRRPRPHLWREPSPDVWSIDEETEAELGSEAGAKEEDKARKSSLVKSEGVDGAAAKPKKKVRFILPAKEQ